MLMRRSTQFTATLSLLLAACGQGHRGGQLDISKTKEAWNANNDPLNLRDNYEVRFDALAKTGELKEKPWADTYWPSYEGGLANRWYGGSGGDSFSYALHSEAEVKSMSVEDLKKLSPAEKYDILQGRYDYPFTMAERGRTSPDDPSWFGLCHGWAPAALNFTEPNPVVVKSSRGIDVPFGSSDVKALLLFAQQDGPDSRMAGDRCNSDDPNSANDPACKDINAGSFHVIMANQFGDLAQGVVADVARGSQVWNQPVFGFDSTILSESESVYPSAAPGTVKIVSVRTKMRYITEVPPSWAPRRFADNPGEEGDKTYQYTIELNSAGEVIGGEWKTGGDHPDFIWTQKAPSLAGRWQDLLRVYEAATR
jgi:hypothetical protein